MSYFNYIDQKLCKHATDYNDKDAMSESKIKDLIYRNYDKLKSTKIRCEDTDCEECDREHLWFCLYCGKIFCGEVKQKHSTDHFGREQHYHYLNLMNYTVWCYVCYSYVQTEKAQYSIKDLFDNTRKYEKWKREQLSFPDQPNGQINSVTFQSSSQQRQFTFSNLAEQFIQRSTFTNIKSGELGVSNYASTCYMQSVLQALAHIPYFAKYFISCQPYLFQRLNKANSIQNSNQQNNNCEQIKIYLQHLFTIYTASALQALQIPAQTEHNLLQNQQAQQQNNLQMSNLYKALQAQNHHYLDDRQQDAQEFLINLFTIFSQILGQKFQHKVSETCPYKYFANIEDSLCYIPQKLINNQRDIVTDCFCGYTTTTSSCCELCSTNFQQKQQYQLNESINELFMFQALDLPQQSDNQQIQLTDCLDSLVLPQQLDKTCNLCKQQGKCTKAIKFHLLPPVLCFTIKCYNQDMSKLTNGVKLPNNLDLKQYLHPDSPHQRFARYANLQIAEQLTTQQLQQTYERLIVQATGMLVGRLVVDAFAKKFNIDQRDLARPDFNQIIECICMSSFSVQFYELFEQAARECKIRLQKVSTTQHKYMMLLKFIQQDISLLKQKKHNTITQLLRQKLNQKYMKQYKIPYDIDALLAGSCEYELCASVVHQGDLKSGHYTAYCRVDNNQYKNFDDNKIILTELNKPKETPYLVFYQKKQNQLQEIIIQMINQEIYSETSRNNITRACDQVFEFYKTAVEYFKKQFNYPIPQYNEKRQLSGEYIYRLQTLPWPGGHQFQNCLDAYGRYAIQPAQTPPSIYVSGRLFMIIEACFGKSDCTTDIQIINKQLIINELENEQQLYDKITTQQQKPEFAISLTFLQKWQFYLFTEPHEQQTRFASCVNADLCNEKRLYNRFDMKHGLKLNVDYIYISGENFEQLKKYYKCFEVEIFEEGDLDNYGVENYDPELDNHNSEFNNDDSQDSIGLDD